MKIARKFFLYISIKKNEIISFAVLRKLHTTRAALTKSLCETHSAACKYVCFRDKILYNQPLSGFLGGFLLEQKVIQQRLTRDKMMGVKLRSEELRSAEDPQI